MKRRLFVFLHLLTIVATLGLTGCSRTIDDIANWKASGNVTKLIQALSDPKYEVRLAATEALGELKAELAVDDLSALYNDPEDEIVKAAVNSLAQIETSSTITPLSAALTLDFAESRKIATVKLGELKATGAIPQLIEALDDEDADVQLAAATSLGQIADPAASEGLAAKLTDSSSNLRKNCAESLGKTGGEAAIKGLIPTMADESDDVSTAARNSLIEIGESSIPSALEALKDPKKTVRAGAIFVLRKLEAIPEDGTDFIWYQLARASVDSKEGLDNGVIANLFKMGDDAIDTLLIAAAHPVEGFREHASIVLERMGEDALDKAVAAAEANTNTDAKNWFTARGSWAGAPSWRIDLWAALVTLDPTFKLDRAVVSSLEMQARPAFTVIVNPQFKLSREYIPFSIALLGDTTKPPPEQPDYDADGIPIIKKRRDMFRGEANRTIAEEKLTEAGYFATLPLIAAIEDEDELVAGNAAHILGGQGEKRALQPLMNVVQKKLRAGDILTDSPFYTALLKMDEPAAEPILLKVRPNPDRAMQVFARQYEGIRPVSAETKDDTGDPSQPVRVRIGYIDRGRIGEMMVTFMPDGEENWVPTPALPAQPQSM